MEGTKGNAPGAVLLDVRTHAGGSVALGGRGIAAVRAPGDPRRGVLMKPRGQVGHASSSSSAIQATILACTLAFVIGGCSSASQPPQGLEPFSGPFTYAGSTWGFRYESRYVGPDSSRNYQIEGQLRISSKPLDGMNTRYPYDLTITSGSGDFYRYKEFRGDSICGAASVACDPTRLEYVSNYTQDQDMFYEFPNVSTLATEATDWDNLQQNVRYKHFIYLVLEPVCSRINGCWSVLPDEWDYQLSCVWDDGYTVTNYPPCSFGDFAVHWVPLVPGVFNSYREEFGNFYYSELALTCLSGCNQECVADIECDDGLECTSDKCESGHCTHAAEPDTKIPDQIPNDCRYCKNGEWQSLRRNTDVELARVLDSELKACKEGSPNGDYLVGWSQEVNKVVTQAHYCVAGEVPAQSQSKICNGLGTCGSDGVFHVRQKTVDRNAECKSVRDAGKSTYSAKAIATCTICL